MFCTSLSMLECSKFNYDTHFELMWFNSTLITLLRTCSRQSAVVSLSLSFFSSTHPTTILELKKEAFKPGCAHFRRMNRIRATEKVQMRNNAEIYRWCRKNVQKCNAVNNIIRTFMQKKNLI